MPVERAGGVERHPGVHTLSDPLGDLVRKDLNLAVLIVEQTELHRGSSDDRECRGVLLATLTHPLHGIRRPRHTVPPRRRCPCRRRRREDVDDPHFLQPVE